MGTVDGMGFYFLKRKGSFGNGRNLECIVIYYSCAAHGSAASRRLKMLDESISGALKLSPTAAPQVEVGEKQWNNTTSTERLG